MGVQQVCIAHGGRVELKPGGRSGVIQWLMSRVRRVRGRVRGLFGPSIRSRASCSVEDISCAVMIDCTEVPKCTLSSMHTRVGNVCA